MVHAQAQSHANVYAHTHRNTHKLHTSFKRQKQIYLLCDFQEKKYAGARKLSCIWCFCLPSPPEQEMVSPLCLNRQRMKSPPSVLCWFITETVLWSFSPRQTCGWQTRVDEKTKEEQQVGGTWPLVTWRAWNVTSEKLLCLEKHWNSCKDGIRWQYVTYTTIKSFYQDLCST